MNEDYAIATAAPRQVMIQGSLYLVGKFRPRDLGDLGSWLKSQVPDPRLKARDICAGLSDAVALEAWKELSEEAKDWPPSVTSPAGNQLLLLTHEGNSQLLFVALRRHNKSVDMEAARRIAEDATIEEIIAVLNAGFPEDLFAPKSTTSTEMSETADLMEEEGL